MKRKQLLIEMTGKAKVEMPASRMSQQDIDDFRRVMEENLGAIQRDREQQQIQREVERLRQEVERMQRERSVAPAPWQPMSPMWVDGTSVPPKNNPYSVSYDALSAQQNVAQAFGAPVFGSIQKKADTPFGGLSLGGAFLAYGSQAASH
jgi:hypothetical protein